MLQEIVVHSKTDNTTYFATYFHNIVPYDKGERHLITVEAVVAWPRSGMPRRLDPHHLHPEVYDKITEAINNAST